jgi:predicted nucleic acid-binding protein
LRRRFLSDASTVIALATAGRLHVLQTLCSRVHCSGAVLEEALVEKPGADAIRAALKAGWLVRLKATGDIPGLGPGEASTILVATKDDVLILDDRAARLDAKARGLRVTGLLGLLVQGARSGRVDRRDALATLEALAKGPFRMTAELYAWAQRELENAART